MPSQVRILHSPVNNNPDSGSENQEPETEIEREVLGVENHSVGGLALDSGLSTFDELGGCSSMVEQQPSKLMTRVRFPSPALREAVSSEQLAYIQKGCREIERIGASS